MVIRMQWGVAAHVNGERCSGRIVQNWRPWSRISIAITHFGVWFCSPSPPKCRIYLYQIVSCVGRVPVVVKASHVSPVEVPAVVLYGFLQINVSKQSRRQRSL